MAATQEEFNRLIEQAVEDPEFAGRLVSDPEGTAVAAGIELPTEVVAVLKESSAGNQSQVVENLNARMSRMLGYFH
jgi:hypothetical protein